MTPELHQRAGDLFHRVLQLPESDRAAFLDSVCGSERELRDHVQRLLNADRGAGQGAFLEQLAMHDVARALARNAPELPASGAVIGRFRLGERIGSGGMGVVYRGEDQQLPRTVAVKILSANPTSGKEAIQRFSREARAASLLNHPNIVVIVDAGFDQGWHYIAMEFVEGSTLRDLIAGGRLPDTAKILQVVSQAASALAAAHEAGIVHRDIKPENIMVHGDGFIKILDFGLAKLRETEGGPPGVSQLSTQPGNVAGTTQYLSPEQVMGEPAGPRSDLFSLGVVAYELATGVRPFDGPTDGSVFDAILHRVPPPPSSLHSAITPELDALILRLLEKDPELRFQTARDLRSACKLLDRSSSGSHSLPRRNPAPTARTIWWTAAALGVPLLALLWFSLRSRPADPLGEIEIRRLTNTGRAARPAISPDGKFVAFVSGEEGENGIRLLQTATGAAIDVVPAARGVIQQPAFSPDGNYIYFVRSQASPEDSGLFQAPALGGAPRLISQAPNLAATLSTDGRLAAFFSQKPDWSAEELTILRLDTGETRALAQRVNPNTFFGFPAWSPDNRKIAVGICAGDPCGLAVVHVDSGRLEKIGAQNHNGVGGTVWLPDGSGIIALLSETNTRFQVHLVEYPGGRLHRMTNDLDEYSGLTISNSGDAIATSVRHHSAHIWTADVDARSAPAVQVTFGREGVPEGEGGIAWAGGGVIVHSSPDPEGWNLKAVQPGGKTVAVTTGRYYNAEQVVCPDGRTVIFKSNRSTRYNLWRTDLITGRTDRITDDEYDDASPACGPDSRSVFFMSRRNGEAAVWRTDFQSRTPVRLFKAPAVNGIMSQDGKWFATFDKTWREAGRVVVLNTETGSTAHSFPLPAGGRLSGGGIRWLPNGSGLVYAFQRDTGSNLWLQPIPAGPPRQLTHFTDGQLGPFSVSADGRRLAFSHGSDTTDVVRIRLGRAPR